MENVDERIENALRDYKREIHQHLSRAMSNVEEMHMQAISKMQEVSEKYIHELHDKHVQAVVLNQNLDAMNDMDELQQKLHEKFHMERQNMLNEVDQRLQMHGQKWELGHAPIMSNMQNRLASLEGGLQHVTQELQKFQQVHANDMATNDRRHAQSLHSSNVQNQQLSGVSVFTETLNKKIVHVLGELDLLRLQMTQAQEKSAKLSPPAHVPMDFQHENAQLKKELELARMGRHFRESFLEKKAQNLMGGSKAASQNVPPPASTQNRQKMAGLIVLEPIGGGEQDTLEVGSVLFDECWVDGAMGGGRDIWMKMPSLRSGPWVLTTGPGMNPPMHHMHHTLPCISSSLVSFKFLCFQMKKEIGMILFGTLKTSSIKWMGGALCQKKRNCRLWKWPCPSPSKMRSS